MLLYTCNKNKIEKELKNMITRSIEKVTAKITDEKTYYGANVTATKIKNLTKLKQE